MQFSPAERDRAEGEVLPGGAVPAEGLHAPGRRPNGGAAGGADVQRTEGAAAALPPAHRHSEGGVAGEYASSWGSEAYTAAGGHGGGLPQRSGEQRVFVGPVSLEADVRILLAHMDHNRLKETATAADQLVAMRAAPAAVAAVEADPREVTVVAAQGGGTGAGRRPAAAKQKKKKQSHPRRPGRPPGCASGTGGMEPRPSAATVIAAGLETCGPGATKRRRRLLHVADQLTGTKFLVDTGASYSIFPHKSKRPPSGPRLRGPGGQDIACWEEKEMAVFFGNERYTWSFWLVAVQFPILGVDFLWANSLIVDAAAGRLIHSKSLRQIPAAEGAVGESGLYAAMCATPPAYRDLFAEFQRVLNSSGELPSPTHGVLHKLETTGPPVTAKFWQLDAAKVKGGKRGFPVYGETGNYTAVQKQLGVPLAYGAQGRRLMAAVWRLPTFEPGYYSGQVPYPHRPGLHRPPSWVLGVLQAGPQEGVLPGVGCRRQCLQNGSHHSLWTMGVPQDAAWTTECRPDIPTADGSGIDRPGLCVCLPGRHPDSQP